MSYKISYTFSDFYNWVTLAEKDDFFIRGFFDGQIKLVFEPRVYELFDVLFKFRVFKNLLSQYWKNHVSLSVYKLFNHVRFLKPNIFNII